MVSFRPRSASPNHRPRTRSPSTRSTSTRSPSPTNRPRTPLHFGATPAVLRLPALPACLGLLSSMKMSSSALSTLLLCAALLSVGSALRCYRCHGYSTINCQNVQECSYEDSCLSLSEKGGKTIRQCIRYTDCDNLRLTQMFPSVDGFTYRCCSSNLCNSAPLRASGATGLLMGALALGLLSCWGP